MSRLWKKYNYVMILAGVALVFGFFMIGSLRDPSPHYIKISVTEGETLWNIAGQYAEQGKMSREAFISWVERHNGINGNMIKAGEKIVIPIEKNEFSDDNRELAMKSQRETKK